MVSLRQPKFRAGAALILAALPLVLAACGGSSSPKTTAPAASTPSSNTAALSISTAKGPAGTYLVGSSGRALYLWAADSSGKSACAGACAVVWTPLVTTGTPSASGGVNASDLGTIVRSDGKKQVTYNGHPLYYYTADSGPGMTHGEGSGSFGAKWWLVAPSGAGITKAASTTAAKSGSSSSSSSSGSSSSSSGGSSSGGGGGWG